MIGNTTIVMLMFSRLNPPTRQLTVWYLDDQWKIKGNHDIDCHFKLMAITVAFV